MQKLRTLTIAMIAAGSVFGLQSAMAAADQPKPGDDSGVAAAVAQVKNQLQRNLAYRNAQNYQADQDLANTLINTTTTNNSSATNTAAQNTILQSSQAFNKQVMNANSYTLDKNKKPVFVQNVDSPATSLQQYADLPAGSTFGVDPNYSYMDLINSETPYNPLNTKIATTTADTCIYGLAGQSADAKMAPLFTAGLMPGVTPIKCAYNPALTQAINYIHMLAGYNSKISSDYSGNEAKLKGLSPDNMTKYKNLVKNTVTARSAGEDALYDVMQGNIAVNGHPSVNNANRTRYTARANSTKWQQDIAQDSQATVQRQQAYMTAEVEKELSELIDLQRKQYALSAINEMQIANLANEMKQQQLLGNLGSAGGQQQAKNQYSSNDKNNNN